MDRGHGVGYRLAEDTDAPAIAALHAESWRSAYRGQLPDSFLDGEVFEERSEAWRARFEDRDGTLTLVAEQGDRLVGFTHSILDQDARWGTVLDNVHVRPDAKRLGIGRQLMAETASRLGPLVRTPGLHLWVHETNHPARLFYKALGGVVTGRDVVDAYGASVPCLRFAWNDLDVLANSRR